MITTVKEARRLWCCRDASHCRGCDCMAWRWFDRPFTQPSARRLSYVEIWECNEEPPRPSDIPQSWTWHPFGGGDDIAGWIEPEEEYLVRLARLRNEAFAARRGYCGLAGKPECE